MFRNAGCFALFALALSGCDTLPACEDVELTNATVDTSSGTPVIAWDGAAAEVVVATSEGFPAWDVRCNCAAEDKHPERNSGCAQTAAEFEYRNCLDTPLAYGTLPDDPNIALETEFDNTKSTADALIPGDTYEAHVQTYCDGSATDGPNMVELIATFVAP